MPLVSEKPETLFPRVALNKHIVCLLRRPSTLIKFFLLKIKDFEMGVLSRFFFFFLISRENSYFLKYNFEFSP